MKNEDQLLNGLRQGNKASFKSLYNHYAEKLYYFSLKYTQDQNEAEEIVQMVFLKIWESREQIKPELSFNAYLIQIGKHMIYRAYQRKELKRRYEIESGKQVSLSDSTEEYIVFSDLETHANQYIKEMPEKRKQVFMLSRMEGKSQEEIAEKLGISIGTVKQHMNKALKSLNYKMVRDGLLTLLPFLFL